MRKLLYLLLAIPLLGAAEPAPACERTGPTPTDADLFAKASAVFVARIVRADEVELPHPDDGGRGGPPAVEATFRLIEVLKGRPPADGKVRGPIPHRCTRSLLVGLEYVIFIDESDPFIVWAAQDKGTRPFPFEPPGREKAPSQDTWCHFKQCQLQKLRDLARKSP